MKLSIAAATLIGMAIAAPAIKAVSQEQHCDIEAVKADPIHAMSDHRLSNEVVKRQLDDFEDILSLIRLTERDDTETSA